MTKRRLAHSFGISLLSFIAVAVVLMSTASSSLAGRTWGQYLATTWRLYVPGGSVEPPRIDTRPVYKGERQRGKSVLIESRTANHHLGDKGYVIAAAIRPRKEHFSGGLEATAIWAKGVPCAGQAPKMAVEVVEGIYDAKSGYYYARDDASYMQSRGLPVSKPYTLTPRAVARRSWKPKRGSTSSPAYYFKLPGKLRRDRPYIYRVALANPLVTLTCKRALIVHTAAFVGQAADGLRNPVLPPPV